MSDPVSSLRPEVARMIHAHECGCSEGPDDSDFDLADRIIRRVILNVMTQEAQSEGLYDATDNQVPQTD
jgi:hypothetical protein